MDYMFRLNQTGDQFPGVSLPFQLYPTQQTHRPPPSPSFGWRRKLSSDADKDDDVVHPSEIKKRKIMHRDIERQRRREMATLYASLRSLLPLEYTKGKRSMSDNMQEAVNYIRNLQKKTEELSDRRDRLKSVSKRSSCSNIAGIMEDVVTVRSSWGGIEVVMNTSTEEGLPLSRVLRLLITEGLSIITCNSTTVKGRLFHSIESEVITGGRKTDVSELQQKLRSLVCQT